MSLIAAFAFAALMAGDPQAAPKQVSPPSNHRVIGPAINRAPRTMDIFKDNEEQRFIQDVRRRLGQAEYNRRMFEDRMALADQLDQLIGSDLCDDARTLANSSRHKDIAGEVERVCASRPGL